MVTLFNSKRKIYTPFFRKLASLSVITPGLQYTDYIKNVLN